jgi:outer membrane lipoprotein LolB
MAAIVLTVLSGCAQAPSVPTPARDVSDLSEWQASGRIAVSGANAGGSGSFTWQQHGASTQVQLRGPIGIGSLRLTLTDTTMRVETADGQVFEADEAQSELTARLGAFVPARNLRYWLVGTAAPGEHQWINGTETATLTQQDWRIDYQRFAVTGGTRLPMKLVAESGPAKVRILIDRWNLGR